MTLGIARAGFDIDLADGEEREDALAKVLKHGKIEVKRDYGYASTGNLYIEYAQQWGLGSSDRHSGIMVSTADYWAIEYFENHWILVPTQRLRKIVERIIRDHPHRCVRGGDYNRTAGALVKMEDLT